MMLLPWRGRTNKKAFMERCLRVVQKRFPQAQVTPSGELELDIVFPGGTQHNMYFGRAYNEFFKKPREFDAIVERWLQSIAERTQWQPVGLDRLVPMIKDRAWVRSLDDPSRNWIEDYNEHLVVAYAEYKASFQYCLHTDIDKLGVPRQQLRQRALDNLAALSAKRNVAQQGSLYAVNVGGNFEASQILLEDFWADAQIRTGALIAVPDRDTLAVSVDDSPAAVWSLAAAAARLARSEPYPITSLLFARGDAGPMRAIDTTQDDDSHPIPRLDVIDVNVIKRGGGAEQAIIIATPLDAGPRSVFRLFTKIDGYLNYMVSDQFRKESGPPSPETTSIVVHIHADCAREIFELLENAVPWARQRKAHLEVRTDV